MASNAPLGGDPQLSRAATRRRRARPAGRAAGWLLAAALAMLAALARPAAAQPNYTPLERGDFTEQEEQLTVVRGLEVGLDYAARILKDTARNIPDGEGSTQLHQDIRLELRTIFHRDISLHLVLEPEVQSFNQSDVRRPPSTDRGRVPEGQQTGINAREAYLRYGFNPNSGLLLGKQEVSLGDRRGKTFDAIVPAITYDCRVGTWCMPFGGLRINKGEDWIYHWALEYTGWDAEVEKLRDTFQVEIFRIWYTEKNVPLGTNLGPGFENPDDPTQSDGTIVTDDAGNAIYYDAHGTDYYGLRLDWEAVHFFFNFDFVSAQGSRVYHTYRSPDTGIDTEMTFDDIATIRRQRQKVHGVVWESEIGYRWANAKLGLHLLNGSGDPPRPAKDGQNFLRGLDGYYEITPGTYSGNRLYFNGSDSQVDGGGGLGHSVNNTRMVGLYLDVADPEGNKVGYSAGLYDLRYNYSILDFKGQRRDYIGLEWDNMLTFYLHKAIRLQVEANFIQQGGAFRFDDFSTPDNRRELLFQAVGRFVYRF